MNCLAWNAPPPLAALAAAVRNHTKPLYLIVCLPDCRIPEFRPSESELGELRQNELCKFRQSPCAEESALRQAIAGKLGCIQFNGANVLENILPGVHLWLMPSENAARLGEHFPQPVEWQTEAVPQLPPQPAKPWFRPPEHRTVPTRAVVIGAGIAGAATARALAEHGLPVTVLETAEPAHAASGNRQGLLYAKISPHNTEQTELLLCGYGYTRRLLETLLPNRESWGGNGVLHLNHDAGETRRNQALGAQTHHAHLYRPVDAAEAAQIVGIETAQSGLYWPQGVWLHPPALVRALLDHPLIELHTRTPVLAAEHDGKEWQIRTPSHTFSGSHLIYCTGAHSPQAADPNVSSLPYRLVRGQTDLAAAVPYSKQLRCALSGAGYISPAWQGLHCYGATFVQHDTGTDWRETDRQTNRATLHELNEQLAAQLLHNNPQNLFFSDGLDSPHQHQRPSETRSDGLTLQGHAALRCDSPDHLPIVGALGDIAAMQSVYAKLAHDKNYRLDTPCPYLPNAYINTAHGSRGLATAPICAAALAAEILGLPNPLSQRIRTALAPNRTVIRALIRPKKQSGQ